MSSVDPKAYVYLYTGAVALLTTEMKLIISTMLHRDPAAIFLMGHTTNAYMWSLVGASAIGMGLVWLTGVYSLGRHSIALLTMFGLAGGIMTFHPRVPPPTLSSKPIPVVEKPDGTVEMDIEHINEPNVRSTLFGEEQPEEDGWIAKRVKGVVVKLLPPLKKEFNRVVDSAILQGKGYQIRRTVVIPPAQKDKAVAAALEKSQGKEDLYKTLETEAMVSVESLVAKGRAFTNVSAYGIMNVLIRANNERKIEKEELWAAIRHVFELAVTHNKHVRKEISSTDANKHKEAIIDMFKKLVPEEEENILELETFYQRLIKMKG